MAVPTAPAPAWAAAVLQSQRAVGNRAVAQLLADGAGGRSRPTKAWCPTHGFAGTGGCPGARRRDRQVQHGPGAGGCGPLVGRTGRRRGRGQSLRRPRRTELQRRRDRPRPAQGDRPGAVQPGDVGKLRAQGGRLEGAPQHRRGQGDRIAGRADGGPDRRGQTPLLRLREANDAGEGPLRQRPVRSDLQPDPRPAGQDHRAAPRDEGRPDLGLRHRRVEAISAGDGRADSGGLGPTRRGRRPPTPTRGRRDRGARTLLREARRTQARAHHAARTGVRFRRSTPSMPSTTSTTPRAPSPTTSTCGCPGCNSCA